jgi:hypothetical protein
MKLQDLHRTKISEAATDEVVPDVTDEVTPEATDVAKLSDIWNEQGENSSTFIPRQQFAVKKVGEEFEINSVNNSERKLLKKIDQNKLNAEYTQVSAETDAEGYSTYILKSSVDAFSYTGQSKIIKSGSASATLMDGDYVVKRPKGGDKFEFLVVDKKEFEAKYVQQT